MRMLSCILFGCIITSKALAGVSGPDAADQGAQGSSTSPWYFNLRNAAGTEIGTSSNPVRVDPTGTTTQPVSAASLPLPTGAATSANQSTEITSLQLIDDIPHAEGATVSKGVPMMGQLDDTSTTAASEDKATVLRATPQRALHTNLRNQAGTEIGTSTNPVRTDPTGTTTQPMSAASLPLPTGASTSANQTTIDGHITDTHGAVSPGTAATKSELAGCVYTAAGVTLTNGQQAAQQCTAAGNLKTDTTVSSITLSAGQVPTFSNKLVVDISATPINVTSSVTYTTIYTYTGSGLLVGFNQEYNNIAIVVKLTIDGNVVFDGVDISTLNGFFFTANTIDRRQNGQGITTSSSTIDFSMRQPIKFGTSVVISARLTSGSTTRTFNQGVVYIQKDT